MINAIPQEILNEFSKKIPNTKRLSNDSQTFIEQYYCFYNMKFTYDNFNQKIFLTFKLMKNNITEIPICGFNDCKKQKMVVKVSGELSNGCCRSHAMQNTNIEKYGVNNVTKIKEVRDKQKQTCLKRYGVDNPSKNKVIRNTQKQTCLKRYGVLYPQQSELIKEKTKVKNISNHGFEWNMQSTNCLNKRKITYLKKYGVDHPLKSDFIKEKIKETNLLVYGYSNPMQHPDIADKQQKNAFKLKEYIWATGEVSLLQGHEPIVLTELEKKGYKFSDVITNKRDMPEIWYYFNNKKHRYYPDFYIPEENKIIEVKSEYTYNMEVERNEAKFSAVKAKGFDFILEIR